VLQVRSCLSLRYILPAILYAPSNQRVSLLSRASISNSSNREQRFARTYSGRRRAGREGSGPRETGGRSPFVPVGACVPLACIHISVSIHVWTCSRLHSEGVSLFLSFSHTNPLIIPGGRRPGRILRALRVCIPCAGLRVPYSLAAAAAWGPEDR
jgi:hypothetical protein